MGSRRDLIRMTDDEIEAFLAGRRTMSIATHSPDGSIHLVAMWYGFLDGHPAFETYAKSQKVLNLRRNPRISALVEAGEGYEELHGVELVGHAVIVDDEESCLAVARSVVERYYPLDDSEQQDSAARALMAKRVAVKVVAERVVSWDHRKLT